MKKGACDKIRIVAGSRFQADTYLAERDISNVRLAYITSEEQLRGLERPEVIFYGGWGINPKINAIIGEISRRRGSIKFE
jgi:hypothetical protein